MPETDRNISETLHIPPVCREQFLPVQADFAWPLRERGVFVAGISDLVTPFAVGRVAPSFHAVLGTVSGRATFRASQSEGVMEAGDVWIGPAGCSYAYEADGPWRVCWFHLVLGPRVRPQSDGITLFRDSSLVGSLWGTMKGLMAEAVRGEAGGAVAARAYAEILGVLLDRGVGEISGASRRTEQRLARLWERVDADLAAPWTVAALAADLCVSPAHLHRLTRRHQGVPPMEVVARLRMRRAEAILLRTDETLDRVAAAVGYETPFAFSRAFKRRTGLSPNAFRHRRRE